MEKSYELMIRQTGDDIMQKINEEYDDKVYHQFRLPFDENAMRNAKLFVELVRIAREKYHAVL